MPNNFEQKKVDILLIEDSPGDVRLTKEALNEIKMNSELYIVNDGLEAYQFLLKKDRYQFMPTPDLILLDLNLPKMDGRELLELIKENETLKTIPVIVLSTSNDQDDVNKLYMLQANCYLTKPVDFLGFVELMKAIEMFWMRLVLLPSKAIKK